MNRELLVRNRQRAARLDGRLLRRVTLAALTDLLALSEFELSIGVVSPARMAGFNETYLRHQGVTDVIAFSYAEPCRKPPRRRPRSLAQPSGRGPDRREGTRLQGDLLVCLAQVQAQARRYRTPWPRELVRCVVHGVLHLLGHDDSTPGARRSMKRREDQLLRALGRRFPLRQLDPSRC